MKIKMTSNMKKEASKFSEFQKDLKEAIFVGVDKALLRALFKLKSDVRIAVEQRRLVASKEGSSNLPKEIEKIPPTRADIIKMITGENLQLSSTFQARKDNIVYQKNDMSNIIPVVNNHVGLSQSIHSGTTYEEYLGKIMNRFDKGIYVDPKTGKSMLLTEDGANKLRDAVKIECSTKHIDHPDSKKAFYRWKTSLNKNARKTPSRKYINARMFQDEVKKIMQQHTIPLDPLVDLVLEGDLKEAQKILQQQGNNRFAPLVDKLDNMKENRDLPPDEQALMNIITLIRNMKIQKKKTKDKVQYSIVSSYSEDGEQFEDFFTLIQREISMWLPDASEEAYRSLSESIQKAINNYGRA